MALPGRRRCGQGSCFLSKSPLDKRDHGPKHQEWSLHIFKAFDETYEAKWPLQSTSVPCESLVGPHLERCAFYASEPRFVGDLCGALARRPLWDTRTSFQKDSIQAAEVKAKDLVPQTINLTFQLSNFCWLSLHLFLVQFLVESPSLAICLPCFGPPWNLEGVKAACLKVLGEETAQLQPADLETWIISLLFQEVMGLNGQKPKKRQIGMKMLHKK